MEQVPAGLLLQLLQVSIRPWSVKLPRAVVAELGGGLTVMYVQRDVFWGTTSPGGITF